MSIQANFNKLVWLKKFNNYFNRKIIGSNSLSNYFSGTQEDSGASMTAQQVFNESVITNFVSGESFEIRGIVNDVPIGIDIGFNYDLQYYGTGSVSFLDYEYKKDKKLIIFYFSTTAVNIEDITGLIFTVDFYYTNRVFKIVNNRNFNGNDDVVTEVVENDLDFSPDYVLVLDPATDNILTRWFVIKHERTRGNQFKYALKRDVIYDRLDELMEAPIYVHKGMLKETDSFVVNDEGMKVNQIKTKEVRLLDPTNIAWMVLYISRTTPETNAVGDVFAVNMKISAATVRQHTYNVPYDVIAIPYYVEPNGTWEDATIIDLDDTTFTSTSVYIADVLEVMTRQLDANLYDIQYLPYCPIGVQITVRGTTNMDLGALSKGGIEHEEFDYITFGGTKVGCLFYIEYNSFSTPLHTENNVSIATNLTKKEASNLQLYRLVSPNYQGTFDLDIAKNNNKIEGLTAYCTYKPYTPFIKVAPKFYAFYGQDYDDCRGLLCGGDFSISRTTDAWISYQLQNKNYQNIFNREVQNLEFNQSIEMRNQIINAVVGHFTATAAGAGAGAMVGGWVGAIIGGAVAGTTSLVAGVVDTITLYQQQREQKSLMLDKYNYELGNIQALPYTLTKVSSIDYVSKIYPFVEIYNCTPEELQAFRDKIKYESMTVLRIDTMYNYYNRFDDLCYFKGELIRSDELAEETYFFDAVYAELMKGVYF